MARAAERVHLRRTQLFRVEDGGLAACRGVPPAGPVASLAAHTELARLDPQIPGQRKRACRMTLKAAQDRRFRIERRVKDPERFLCIRRACVPVAGRQRERAGGRVVTQVVFHVPALIHLADERHGLIARTESPFHTRFDRLLSIEDADSKSAVGALPVQAEIRRTIGGELVRKGRGEAMVRSAGESSGMAASGLARVLLRVATLAGARADVAVVSTGPLGEQGGGRAEQQRERQYPLQGAGYNTNVRRQP